MTIPQNVKDALKPLECEIADPEDCTAWQTIRDHLMSQDESIANLRSAAQKALLANADLRAHANLAESRLAAANALLREIRRCTVLSPSLLEDVKSHLQGAVDE